MNKSIVIVVVIIVALALGVPALSKLAKKPVAVAPPAPTKQAESAPAPAAPAPAPASAAAPAAAPSADPGAASASADPKVFVGSTWSIKGATVSLQADGVADVKHPAFPTALKGTWTTAANTLTISVMGKSYTAQVAGDKLMLDGKPVERVQ